MKGDHTGAAGKGGLRRQTETQGRWIHRSDTVSFYRPHQPGSYPIVAATYEVVCSKYPDPEVGTAVRAFLQSTIGAGQNGLGDNGYVRVPDTFIFRLSVAVNAIA